MLNEDESNEEFNGEEDNDDDDAAGAAIDSGEVTPLILYGSDYD